MPACRVYEFERKARFLIYQIILSKNQPSSTPSAFLCHSFLPSYIYAFFAIPRFMDAQPTFEDWSTYQVSFYDCVVLSCSVDCGKPAEQSINFVGKTSHDDRTWHSDMLTW
jgi:hypothetical protein